MLPLLAERRFLAASASSIAFQAVSTLFLLVFHGWGIPALVWGMVVGGFAQLLVVAIGLGDLRSRLRLDLDLRAPVVRKMLYLTVPTYVGNLSAQLNSFINRGFASLLPAGGVSSLQYAWTLTEAPVSLLASPASRTLFPYLATQFVEDEKRARANLGRALFMLAVIFAPIAVGTFVLAGPVVKVLLERGSFDARPTELTVAALRWGNAIFDHNNTAFPLAGKHTGLECSKCHSKGVYKGTPSQCVACHEDKHNGQNGTDCTACHTPARWDK